MNDFDKKFDEFLEGCQKIVDEGMRNYSWEQKLTTKKGSKYIKIISEDVGEGMNSRRVWGFVHKLITRKGSKYIKIISEDVGMGNSNSRRVWGFVDRSNGDILKPANWKSPAKHNRGNIFDEDPLLFIGQYGPAYMDQIKKYYGV